MTLRLQLYNKWIFKYLVLRSTGRHIFLNIHVLMLAMLQNAQRALEFMYTLPTEKRSWKLQRWLIYVLNVSMFSFLRSVYGLCPVTIFRNIHTSAVGALRLLKSYNRQIDVFDMKVFEITKHSLSKRNNVCLFKAHVTEEHHRLSSHKSVIKLFLLGFQSVSFCLLQKFVPQLRLMPICHFCAFG